MPESDLSKKEIEIIKEALNIRKFCIPLSDSTFTKTDAILSRFINEKHKIRTIDRPWVIGSIKESNLNLINTFETLSDYDAIMAKKTTIKKAEEFDIVIGLINKLQPKSHRKTKLFKDKLTKLSQLGILEKVLFSEANNVLYKIGLLFSNGYGIRYDNMIEAYQNFEIELINITDYQNSTTPDNFLNILDKTSPLQPYLLQIKNLIEKYK